jgi:hypothetical protein
MYSKSIVNLLEYFKIPSWIYQFFVGLQNQQLVTLEFSQWLNDGNNYFFMHISILETKLKSIIDKYGALLLNNYSKIGQGVVISKKKKRHPRMYKNKRIME